MIGPPVAAVGDDNPTEVDSPDDDGVVTTVEEIEAFHIVRAILASSIDPARVVMRDTKSYCGILLDDNNRKPICRLRFNYSQKYLGLFQADKSEVREPLLHLVEIYKFASQLNETVAAYDARKNDTDLPETAS